MLDAVEALANRVSGWASHRRVKVHLDRQQTPSAWVQAILANSRWRSGDVVEKYLVAATLERRFSQLTIPNHPAHAGDQQTARSGDIEISHLVYHVTAAPSRAVIQKCAANAGAGLHPILLVPGEVTNKARVLAEEEGLQDEITIASIEDFVALNIIEMATDQHRDFYAVLSDIVQIYNRRLSEVETDLSLQIQLR